MQDEKTSIPSEPGVWFAGNTENGDLVYQVICKPNEFMSQHSLEEFYKWKMFARPERTLKLFLRFYFHFVIDHGSSLSADDKDELMLFFMSLADIVSHDTGVTRNSLLADGLKG